MSDEKSIVDMPHIVVVGNAFDGMTAYGPFEDFFAANQFIAKGIPDDWVIVPIQPPEKIDGN